jgi:hypothetical protein
MTENSISSIIPPLQDNTSKVCTDDDVVDWELTESQSQSQSQSGELKHVAHDRNHELSSLQFDLSLLELNPEMPKHVYVTAAMHTATDTDVSDTDNAQSNGSGSGAGSMSSESESDAFAMECVYDRTLLRMTSQRFRMLLETPVIMVSYRSTKKMRKRWRNASDDAFGDIYRLMLSLSDIEDVTEMEDLIAYFHPHIQQVCITPWIDIEHRWVVTDARLLLMCLRSAPSLRTLIVPDCINVHGSFLPTLNARVAPSLRHVCLRYADINPSYLTAFKHSTLEELDLWGCKGLNNPVFLQRLNQNLPSLRILDVSFTFVPGLHKLTHSTLRKLRVARCVLEQSFFSNLGEACPALEYLDLSWLDSHTHLLCLTHPTLRTLDLSCSHVTDIAAHSLSTRVPQLRNIHIHGTEIPSPIRDQWIAPVLLQQRKVALILALKRLNWIGNEQDFAAAVVGSGSGGGSGGGGGGIHSIDVEAPDEDSLFEMFDNDDSEVVDAAVAAHQARIRAAALSHDPHLGFLSHSVLACIFEFATELSVSKQTKDEVLHIKVEPKPEPAKSAASTSTQKQPPKGSWTDIFFDYVSDHSDDDTLNGDGNHMTDTTAKSTDIDSDEDGESVFKNGTTTTPDVIWDMPDLNDYVASTSNASTDDQFDPFAASIHGTVMDDDSKHSAAHDSDDDWSRFSDDDNTDTISTAAAAGAVTAEQQPSLVVVDLFDGALSLSVPVTATVTAAGSGTGGTDIISNHDSTQKHESDQDDDDDDHDEPLHAIVHDGDFW